MSPGPINTSDYNQSGNMPMHTPLIVKSTELYLFANDMPSRYDNNEGSLMVMIKRTARQQRTALRPLAAARAICTRLPAQGALAIGKRPGTHSAPVFVAPACQIPRTP
jgi:hypothetical protein